MEQVLNRDRVSNPIKLLIELTLHVQRFQDVQIDDLTATADNHTISNPLFEKLNRTITHMARHDTLTGGWDAAALYMPKNCLLYTSIQKL